MAASCISVSLGAAASLVLAGKPFQGVSSSQAAVRHGFAAASVFDLQRKLALGFGFESLGSRATKNGGIIARAVELEENKDGILFTADDDDEPAAPVDASDDESAAAEAAPVSAPAANNKIYVGNLPWSVDSKQLAEVFQEYGDVELVEVIYDRDTQRSRGFAFVTMRTTEDAESAIEKLDGSELGGRALKVNVTQVSKEPRSFRNDRPPSRERRDGGNYAPRSGGVVNSENRIFLGNLAWDVDDVAVTQLVSEYGQVLDARVIHDRETGRSKGFGYATMAAAADVETAIQALDGAEYEGRVLRVNRASDKPERKPRTFQ